MDWNQIISVISELVKEDNVRSQIYKRLLDGSDWSSKDIIEEECLGYDDVFDEVWSEFFADDEDDEYLNEDDGDDIDYDNDD